MRCLLAILVALAGIRPAFGDVVASTLRADAGGSAAHLILAWAAPTSANLVGHGRTARLRLSRPLAGDLGAARAALSGWLTSLGRDGRSGELVIGLAAGVHTTLAARSAGTYVLTLTRGPARGEDATGSEPRQLPPRSPDRQATASPGLPALASISPATGPLPAEELKATPSLRFAWNRPVPAAIFEHAGVVWMVFGARRRDSADGDRALSAPSGWNELPVLERDDLVAFRFRVPAREPIGLRAIRQGTAWLVEPATPPGPTGQASEPQQQDGRLTVHATGKLATVDDPETGDQLHLLLPDDPAVRQPQHLALVDLELLPTAAGLAWRELADGIVATRRRNDLELSRPGGLRLARASPPALPGPAAPQAVPAGAGTTTTSATGGPADTAPAEPLGLAALAREGALASRRVEAFRQLAAPDKATAAKARVELARLFVADGLGAEALAVLDARSSTGNRPAGAPTGSGPEVIRGAAEVLLGRADRAAELLTRSPVTPDPDTALWRAAAEADLGHWAPAAEALDRAGRVWADYPPRLRLRLGLSAATILAHAGRTDDALAALRELAAMPLGPDERSRLVLLKGTVQARAGRVREAKETLAAAAKEGDLATRVAATFALTQLPADPRGSATADRLRELTRQRLLWRGHPDEATMLAALADVQRQHGQTAEALATWRTALARTQDGRATAEIAERMCDALAATLSAGETSDAVTAYALYRSYPDLAARLGSAAARALADRLADAGLTDAASTLLARATTDMRTSCGHVPALAAPASIAMIPDAPAHQAEATYPRATLAQMARTAVPLRGSAQDALAAAAANAVALRAGLDALRALPSGGGRAEQAG